MPGIVRDAGRDTAGGPIIQGSSNVFANGSPVVRVGDRIMPHGKGPHAAPVMVSGSGNVLTNNIPTCRAGDSANCGHRASGSGDVIVN